MHRKKFFIRLLLDFLIALVCVGVFLFFFYVHPRREGDAGRVILDIQDMAGEEFNLPQTETDHAGDSQAEGDDKSGNSSEEKKDGGSSRKEGDEGKRSLGKERGGTGGKGGPGNGNSNTKSIQSDKNAGQWEGIAGDETLYTYFDETLQITIKKTQLGEGDDRITYYTADIYLTSVEQFKTAFAEKSYGKNIRESTLEMSGENQAILAISGDSYGNSERGIVVRNGVLYRSEVNDAEICVLFSDGTMEVYTPEQFDNLEILEKDVWQAWNFGPSLLEDGEMKETFQTTSYLNGVNPRCGIGYVSPGHYKFVVVDGRDAGYSKGATMSEFAQIMKDEGCILAYNLDGGKSSAMVYQGSYVNQPAGGGRDISDIIYIGKAEEDG